MIRDILNSLKWSSRLGAKFFWAAPAATSGVVFFTLVSQLSMLLAFFLPLKVIILLGSEGIPRYFPPAFEQIDRDALIVWLSAATVAFYGLYLLAERIVEFGGERGSQTLLTRSHKMVLFENQDELADRAYKRHAEVMAGAVFLLLALAILFWLYQGVALLAAGYVFLVAIVLLSALTVSPGFRTRLEDNLTGWMGVLSGIGFMLAFAYLVIDFLYLDPPGLIPAIIALLLCRQGFNRLSSLVSGLVKQRSQKAKLDALFFHGQAYIPEATPAAHHGLHELLLPENREQWVPALLQEWAGEPQAPALTIQWKQTGLNGIHILWCRTVHGPSYAVKLFAHNRASHAAHEASLLTAPPKGLPAPEWVGATDVSGWRCHILRLSSREQAAAEVAAGTLWRLRERMLCVEVGKTFLARYKRSRSILWQRLSRSMLEDLRVAAEGQDEVHREEMVRRREEWREALAALPLAFTSPDIRPQLVVETDAGEPILLHWGGWALEPAGAGWPVGRKGLLYLDAVFPGGVEIGPRPTDVNQRDLTLSALTAQFEKSYTKQQYLGALKTLARIDACIGYRDMAG